MADGKSIVFAAGIALAVVAFGDTDAHRPVMYHFAVTNTTDKAQTVESVRTSCACLKVMHNEGLATETSAADAIPPGGVWPFEVEMNPAGMEGHVEKTVAVTLAPSGGTQVFKVAADVRLRLGLKPTDAAFGVIRRSDASREITAALAGYVADEVTLGTPTNLCDSASLREEKDTVFDVHLSPDGKSVVAKFRDKDVLPGIYSETWTIPTSDAEIPEIAFSVSARVADAVSVTPQVITVGWDEPVSARMVMVRQLNPDNPVNPVGKTLRDSASLREQFSILSAETKPRKWGDVTVTQRPLNGWRIDIANIDPREVRQFSKKPFLEVKTNLPGMESFEIPLRVVQNGDEK